MAVCAAPVLLMATKPVLPRPNPMTLPAGDWKLVTSAEPTAPRQPTMPVINGSRSRQCQPLPHVVSVTKPLAFGGAASAFAKSNPA